MAPPAALYLALLLLVASCGAEKNGGAPAGEELEWKAAGCKLEAEQQIQELKEADQQSGNSSQLLFLGDSITEVWRGTFCGVPCNPVLELHCDQFAGLMQRYFGQYNPMVQAVAGDRTAHLLWRINQGGLPTQHQPKVVVLLIGINDLANLGMNAPGNDDFSWKLFKAAPTVANRIEETVKVVQERLPSSQILLLGLLPAGIWGLPGQANYRWPSPYKRAVATVNTQLSAYAATQSRVQFLDCGMRFLNSNRTAIDAALLPDSLHPSAAGMERGIAQCIKPLVDLLMQSGNSPQLLFLGDSITELWNGTVCGNPCLPDQRLDCGSNPGLLQRYFGQYRPAVQAVAGDRVEHLVWRMQNGALPTRNQPKVVVLLIGTNDLTALEKAAAGTAALQQKLVWAAPEVARRVQDAVHLLRQRLPRARVVLLGLLPRGISTMQVQYAVHSWPSHYASALSLVNSRLRAVAANQTGVHYVDCSTRFLNAGHTAIDAALMPDALHPSAAGMERGIAQCIKPLVDALMKG